MGDPDIAQILRALDIVRWQRRIYKIQRVHARGLVSGIINTGTGVVGISAEAVGLDTLCATLSAIVENWRRTV